MDQGRRLRPLRAYLAGLIGAAAIVILSFPGIALAIPPPPGCWTVNYNVVGWDNVGSGFQRGIRTDMQVAVPRDDCVRVSSIAVFNSTGDSLVEWGWKLGYDCDGSTYHAVPTAFMVKETPGSGLICEDGVATLTSGVFTPLSLEDVNQNEWWNGRISGIEYAQMKLNFTKGFAITNAERDNPDDLAFAHFKDIEELYEAGWNDFDDVQLNNDTDPDYRFCRVNHHRHTVELPPCA